MHRFALWVLKSEKVHGATLFSQKTGGKAGISAIACAKCYKMLVSKLC